MKIDDLAMMVVSCDSYSEVGRTFFDLQNRFMGWFDAPRYFVNETRDISFENVRTIHVGEGVDWSGKVLRALEEIEENYILFFLEDYFVDHEIDEKRIIDALALMRERNLRYYKISNNPEFKGKRAFEDIDYLVTIPSNVRYGVNLLVALIRKDFLREICAGEDRSAWRVESDLLRTVTDRYEFDLPGCVMDKRKILEVHFAIRNGKWTPETLKFFKKRGIEIPLRGRKILPLWTGLMMRIKMAISDRIPTSRVRCLKKFLRRIGFTFVSDY